MVSVCKSLKPSRQVQTPEPRPSLWRYQSRTDPVDLRSTPGLARDTSDTRRGGKARLTLHYQLECIFCTVEALHGGRKEAMSSDLFRTGLRDGAEARSKSSRGLRCAPPASPPKLTTVGGGGGAVLGACGGGVFPNGLPQGLPWAETAPRTAPLPQGLPWAETGLEAPNMGPAPADMAHVPAGRTGLAPVLQLLPAYAQFGELARLSCSLNLWRFNCDGWGPNCA